MTAVAVGASFLALYSGTGARLRSQIDAQLRTQAGEWRQFTAGADLSTPAALERTARRFIAGQRYHAESLITVVQVNGGRTVSKRPRAGRSGGGPRADAGRPGGTVRRARRPLDRDGRRGRAACAYSCSRSSGTRRAVGTLRLANPLTPVTQAQSSLRRTFVIVGALSLVLASAGGRRARDADRGAAAADHGRGRGGERRRPVDTGRTGGGTRRGGGAGGCVRRDARTAGAGLQAPARVRLRRVPRATHAAGGAAGAGRAAGPRDATSAAATRRPRRCCAASTSSTGWSGDMLTLASAEAGELIEPRTIDLDDFFEDVRRDLPLFGERDFRMTAVGGTLRADPDRLTQVLRNLVRNAVAHTESGRSSRACPLTRSTDASRSSVSDTGPGIPADELDRIFERFHRLDASRSRDSGGTGLGLAIARAIVEAHGGQIRAESAPGRGATFRIELPGYRRPPGLGGDLQLISVPALAPRRSHGTRADAGTRAERPNDEQVDDRRDRREHDRAQPQTSIRPIRHPSACTDRQDPDEHGRAMQRLAISARRSGGAGRRWGRAARPGSRRRCRSR